MNPYRSMTRRLVALLALVGLVAALNACGTPTVEYQLSRFKAAMDNLDILAAKQPQLRMDIERKKMEFNAEFEKVRGLQGEEGSKTIGALCYRVEQYYQQLNPEMAQPAGTTQPGGKLGLQPGQAPGQPIGVQPAAGQPGTPPPGGKLGTTPGAAPGAVAPTDSGFGGGAAPAPAPAPGAAPQGGSGFGGGTAPAPAPGAPTPVQPQGGSGFGGQ